MEEITEEEQTRARKLFAGTCDFVLGVAELKQLPEDNMPEVAFIGRSNVGKSSLINALTGRKDLARTSNTPGRTQQLNFFNLGGQIHIVDLPGYGYAKVSKTQVENWTTLMKNYLRGRPHLRCVFVLVDARHGLKPSDLDMMKMLDSTAVNYRIVLTKCDKQKDEQLVITKQRTEEVLKKHAAAQPIICQTSAWGKFGLDELQVQIMRLTSY
ncbi:MAG: YihA family ribosome biogenesis GTP-binding protein [Alphaproteobacteria bacterium]|nr:YihA family ribosome biogenesis GTP-binding protein [Alphaproteobacteria bacterium]